MGDAQSCFLEPVVAVKLAGRPRHNAYLPWGTARRKQDVQAVAYAAASIEELQSCAEEAAATTQSAPETVVLDGVPKFTWCRGCSFSETLMLVKVMVANAPHSAHNWNELGVWLKWAAVTEHSPAALATALACVAIAQRIRWIQGLPAEPVMDKNAASIRQMLVQRFGVYADTSELFIPGGERKLEQNARRALFIDFDGPGGGFMWSDATLQRFL